MSLVANSRYKLTHEPPPFRRAAHRAALASDATPPTLARFVEDTTNFRLEWWQQAICARLERLMHERGQRVLIHGPPQFGKSIIISQRFPCYGLGIDPLHRFRVACYNVTHATRFSRMNLDLMHSPEYRAAFPAAHVSDRASAEEWSTDARAALRDANPSFKPLGLGSGFVGLGVDTLIIDDPYKNAQEARSPAVNTMLWDWWQQVILSRLNPATNIVVMFHRWWEGDFAGKLIEQGGWETMRYPALGDDGTPLSPRYDAAYLAELRARMGTAFDALYQGTPYPAEGGMFKAGRVQFVDVAPVNARRVRRWDIAASAGTGDYSSGVLEAWEAPGIVYVEDVVRGQWAGDERDRIMRETAERDRARGNVVQLVPQDPGAAGKDQAAHFLRLLGGFTVEVERESGDKVTRADPFASQWNGGNVRIVRNEKWNQAYLDELYAFPQGKNDDQVDGSSGAYNKLANTPSLIPRPPTVTRRG